MGRDYNAGGFLYHAASGKVLLQHRDANAPSFPNLWAGFGGHREDVDRGDPVATWRRELREELGIEVMPEQVVPLHDYVIPSTARHRHVFYALWPTLDVDFALGEGDGFGWFTIREALALPDLMDRARGDLIALRERLGVARAGREHSNVVMPLRGATDVENPAVSARLPLSRVTRGGPKGGAPSFVRERGAGGEGLVRDRPHEQPDLQAELYLIADELRGIANLGRYFADNVYETERADQVRKLAARLAALADEAPAATLRALFEDHWLHVSPAIGVDAVVLTPAGEILLVQRRDNRHWCAPGGIAEIGESPSEAVLRELWEEAGLRGEVVRLLGIFDGRLWGSRSKIHLIHVSYLVQCTDPAPAPGIEMLDAQFFSPDRLPEPMQPGHARFVPACIELARSGGTHVDPASSYGVELPLHQRPEDEAPETG